MKINKLEHRDVVKFIKENKSNQTHFKYIIQLKITMFKIEQEEIVKMFQSLHFFPVIPFY